MHRRFHAADHGLFRRESPLETEKERFAGSLTSSLNPGGLILAPPLGGSSGRKKTRTPAAGSPLPGRLCCGFTGKLVSGAHRLLTYHKVFLKSQLYSVTSDPDAEKPLQQRTESRPGGQRGTEVDSERRALSGLEVPTHTTRSFPI